MRRALDTAGPIARACGVPLRVEAALHERRVGALRGTTAGVAASPDGQRLAFTRSTRAGCDILVVASLGGAERSLGPCGDRDYRRLALALAPTLVGVPRDRAPSLEVGWAGRAPPKTQSSMAFWR